MLDDEQAAAWYAGRLDSLADLPGAEVVTDGPGCTRCRMTYEQAHDLPCPGRIHPDEARPSQQAVGMLPRAERRKRKTAERRQQRRHEPLVRTPLHRAGVGSSAEQALANVRDRRVPACLPELVELADPDLWVPTSIHL